MGGADSSCHVPVVSGMGIICTWKWIMFILFWALNIGIAYAGPNVLKKI